EVRPLLARPAGELLRQRLGLGARLEEHARDLALRERAEEQPAEEGDVEDDEDAEQDAADQEPPREDGALAHPATRIAPARLASPGQRSYIEIVRLWQLLT